MSRNTCQWLFVLTHPFAHVIVHTPWTSLSSKMKQDFCHLLPLFPPVSWSSTCPHPEVTFSMTVKASFVQLPPTLGLSNKHLSGLFPSSFLPLPCPHQKIFAWPKKAHAVYSFQDTDSCKAAKFPSPFIWLLNGQRGQKTTYERSAIYTNKLKHNCTLTMDASNLNNEQCIHTKNVYNQQIKNIKIYN